ncbi:hypothetical protein GCM10023317_15000 [Actinopolymorpha pittospori]
MHRPGTYYYSTSPTRAGRSCVWSDHVGSTHPDACTAVRSGPARSSRGPAPGCHRWDGSGDGTCATEAVATGRPGPPEWAERHEWAAGPAAGVHDPDQLGQSIS